jgi:hypothetical protein
MHARLFAVSFSLLLRTSLQKAARSQSYRGFEVYSSLFHPKTRDAFAFCRFAVADRRELHRISRLQPLLSLEMRLGVRIARSEDEHTLIDPLHADQWMPVLSLRNERECWSLLHNAAAAALERYPTSLADDQQSLQRLANSAFLERITLEQRIGEKQALQFFVDFAEAVRPSLLADRWWADIRREWPALLTRFPSAHEYLLSAIAPILHRRYIPVLRRHQRTQCPPLMTFEQRSQTLW